MQQELVFFGLFDRADGKGKQYQAHFTAENGTKYIFVPNEYSTALKIEETGLWLVEPIKRVFADARGGFEMWAVSACKKVEGFDRELRVVWDTNFHSTQWFTTTQVDGDVQTDLIIRRQDHLNLLKAPAHYRAFRHEAVWKVRGVKILLWNPKHRQIEVELVTCVVQDYIPESEKRKMSMFSSPRIRPQQKTRVHLPVNRFPKPSQETFGQQLDRVFERIGKKG